MINGNECNEERQVIHEQNVNLSNMLYFSWIGLKFDP